MNKEKSRKGKKDFKLTFLPFETSIEVPSGTSILDAVAKAHLPLKTTCGGKGTCGDCVVQILSGTYRSKPSAALSDQLVSQGYALACRTEVLDDLTVQLPQFQELSIESIVDSKFFEEQKDRISGFYEVDPPVKKIELELSPPTLEDNYSDLKRLERELQKRFTLDNLNCEYSVLKKLAHVVRENQGKICIVLFISGKSGTIIDVVPQSARKKIYGVACDVGTSTVALHLVDLQSGEILSSRSSFNQQIKCGEDVISRINYAQKPERLQELHNLVILTINHLMKKAADSSGVSLSDIYYASLSGNTTMTHLLLNLEPRFIREEPYVPTINQVPTVWSRDLGLSMNQEGRAVCAPAVGSYVGGDITAGLLCTPILGDSEKISLFIDAGTNGELVVGNKDWLMACACSAGPAFEGGGIKCGMPASEGAIEAIKIDDGKLDYKVINDTLPKGLCGSGLVDLLAELFILGYVDRRGKFNMKKVEKMIVETEEGNGLLIEQGAQSFWGKDLVITENDISHLVRSKGAVYSACSVLLKGAGLSLDKIDSFYVAGGFGQHLNIENAIRIGLLPDVDRNRFHYLGNSSLLGAYLILLSNKNIDFVNEIADKITYIELNTEPSYMNEYTGALFFPHTEMDLFPSVKKLFSSSNR
jgi:uncharacterized 2Fe-2S/4Fe-4S cluster protein (DUF4445 family)